jgi:hypothetical protein
MGALQGLRGGWPGFVLTVPIGAIGGAVYGTLCAVESTNFPNADADFQQMLQATNAGLLKTEIETLMNSPRAECTAPDLPDERRRPPGAVVTIQKISAGMGCLNGKQNFWVEVRWRTAIAKSSFKWDTTTKVQRTSPLEVAEWFARPDEARAEMEQVFVEIAKDMSYRLTVK